MNVVVKSNVNAAYHHGTLLNMLSHHEFQIVKLIHQVIVYHNEDIHQSNELIKQLNGVLMHEQFLTKEHKQME